MGTKKELKWPIRGVSPLEKKKMGCPLPSPWGAINFTGGQAGDSKPSELVGELKGSAKQLRRNIGKKVLK